MAQNLLANPLFSIAPSATGLAEHWTVVGTAGTKTPSIGVGVKGPNAQRLVVAGSAAAQNAGIYQASLGVGSAVAGETVTLSVGVTEHVAVNMSWMVALIARTAAAGFIGFYSAAISGTGITTLTQLLPATTSYVQVYAAYTNTLDLDDTGSIAIDWVKLEKAAAATAVETLICPVIGSPIVRSAL